MSIKINLGCGNKIIKGYINIDAISKNDEVVIDDVKFLNSINDKTVSEIYACHVLEHFGRKEIEFVLNTWFQKLESGGLIKISVPDIESVFKKYQEGTSLSVLIGLLYGGQRNEYDYHKIGFDFLSLKLVLEKVGFTDIKRYDWRLTDHCEIDDYSQAYLPHMDKEKGTLMSLNIEARKPH